jgi:hypothetical protein
VDPPFDSLLQGPALAAASRLVATDGLIYLEAPVPLAEPRLREAGLEAVRAGRAGKVAFHLLRLARA